MFGDNRTEGAAPDDDYIEVAPPTGNRLCRAIERFPQRVTQEAPHVIERERGRLGR
jgi:hypothetical protein